LLLLLRLLLLLTKEAATSGLRARTETSATEQTATGRRLLLLLSRLLLTKREARGARLLSRLTERARALCGLTKSARAGGTKSGLGSAEASESGRRAGLLLLLRLLLTERSGGAEETAGLLLWLLLLLRLAEETSRRCRAKGTSLLLLGLLSLPKQACRRPRRTRSKASGSAGLTETRGSCRTPKQTSWLGAERRSGLSGLPECACLSRWLAKSSRLSRPKPSRSGLRGAGILPALLVVHDPQLVKARTLVRVHGGDRVEEVGRRVLCAREGGGILLPGRHVRRVGSTGRRRGNILVRGIRVRRTSCPASSERRGRLGSKQSRCRTRTETASGGRWLATEKTAACRGGSSKRGSLATSKQTATSYSSISGAP
jgi:hypothetical protein